MKREFQRGPAASIRDLQRLLGVILTKAPTEAIVRARAEILLAYLVRVPVAVLIANNHARYVDANRAASRLTGYPRAELLRMSLWSLTPEPSRTVATRLWRDFLKRGRMTGRFRLRCKDGTIVEANYFAVANVLPGVHVSALARTGAANQGRRRK